MRRIRRIPVLFGISMALIAVLGVLFYWNLYLLGGAEDGPFTRGPYVVSVNPTMAELRFSGPDPEDVVLTAVAPDGTSVAAIGGRFERLQSGSDQPCARGCGQGAHRSAARGRRPAGPAGAGRPGHCVGQRTGSAHHKCGREPG